jgi:hypothetical protein
VTTTATTAPNRSDCLAIPTARPGFDAPTARDTMAIVPTPMALATTMTMKKSWVTNPMAAWMSGPMKPAT